MGPVAPVMCLVGTCGSSHTLCPLLTSRMGAASQPKTMLLRGYAKETEIITLLLKADLTLCAAHDRLQHRLLGGMLRRRVLPEGVAGVPSAHSRTVVLYKTMFPDFLDARPAAHLAAWWHIFCIICSRRGGLRMPGAYTARHSAVALILHYLQ